MEAVTRRGPSRWKRLSVPTARLNTLRGLTRSGLWSSFSCLGKGPYPPCSRVVSLEVTVPLVPSGLVQFVIGLAAVAYVPLHAKPIDRSEEHTSELQSPCNL